MIQPRFEPTFEAWRDLARDFLLEGHAPGGINWSDSNVSLFSFAETGKPLPLGKVPVVPKLFLDLAKDVAYARDPDRWALLYRILYRLQHENPLLMNITVDEDIHRAMGLSRSVRRDVHKLHAFVRFKKSVSNGGEIYVAWHKAEHYALRPGASFFARRFGDRRWSIFTPDESAHWDLEKLTFGEGLQHHEFLARDDWDEVWKTYYKSIFNPARIKIKMMKSEMSPKYWSSMPETALIPELVREAPQRLQTMAKNHRVAAQVNADLSLPELKESAKSCTACPLYRQATHVVFGEGPVRAKIMIVGEQPGDQEDLAGQPFVGPSGEVLDSALRAAGLRRDQIYVTNAVKHFKWTRQGKTRLHQKPSGQEMHACKPWLEAEIQKVKPSVIIALGATAGTAVLGRLPKITSERGRVMTGFGLAPQIVLSWHPSAILRTTDEVEKNQRMQNLCDDLRLVAQASLRSGDAIRTSDESG